MISLLNNFHLYSSNGSVVTSIKPKTKETFRTATILFIIILEKNLLNVTHASKFCRHE